MLGVGHHRLVAIALLALSATIAVAQLDVNLSLGNNPEFNKMLPKADEKAEAAVKVVNATTTTTSAPKDVKRADIEHSEIGKAGEEDEYGETYDYNDYYEDELEEKKAAGKKAEGKQQVIVKENVHTWKLKPIKGNDQNTLEDEKRSKPKVADKSGLLDDIVDGDVDDDDDDDDDEDDDEAYDEYEDVETSKPSTTTTTSTVRPGRSGKKTPITATPAKSTKTATTSTTTVVPDKYFGCPQNCVCQLNFNGYRVANCDRLDAETMHFDGSITDLEVLNVPPRYPLLFGANFFKLIGLQHVNSIKIVDSTIQNVHPDAFKGLDQLYAVNLTNTGLDMLPPDAFAHNTKLRILSLAGNDLHAMQAKSSPFGDYMLNAPTVEELYLTRCNIKQLLPNSFSRLPNVVFIGLAENMLTTVPHNIFHKLGALEELDLSSNSIENLPRHVFDNTSLAILSMRYNEMSGRPAFVAPELQKLDLSYNKLATITDMMFTDMPNLNNLVLKGNSIRKVHHAAFAPLKDLRHIDLSFNDLEQVSELLFLENAFLDTIRLNDNARLKKLPMEGFNSQKKDFNVYLFDASNCDLSELGENTFRTMPGLTMLNLSWNNIESVGAGLFSYLSKLVKLDLSNNLIGELGDMLFLHNRYLRKLYLAGNPLEKLSSKVFLPTKQLAELDLSDCNLKTIWTDADKAAQSKTLLKNLKSLNVSNNEIAHIRVAELAQLERLAVFDLSNNKMSCDQDFRDLMKWLNKKKIASGHLRGFLRESLEPSELLHMEGISAWEEYSLTRCKKFTAPKKSSPDNETDNGGTDLDDGDAVDDDDDEIVDSIHDKANEHLDGDNAYDDDDGPDADADVGGLAADADDEDDEDDDDDDDDDNDDDDGPVEGEKEIKLISDIIDHGVKATEVKLARSNNKVVDSAEKKKTSGADADNEDDDEYGDDEDDEDDEDDDDDTQTDDVDHFEPLRSLYMQYGYVMPLLLVTLSVLAILLALAKIVSVMMHRRGERYRQALLASKNSIVYQKLSEEIGAPMTPKLHRYAPIQQV